MKNFTPSVKIETIMPAIATPKKIKGIDFLGEIPKTKAANAPLHPPVIGRGIATKVTKAISSIVSNFFVCFDLVLSNNF